jgi:hypothetical protein
MEITMLRQNWIHRLSLFIVIILGTAACAGYPSGPNNPEPGDDNYTVAEDGFLPVGAEDGILANDLPKEGTENILTTVGNFETEGGGQLDLAEDGSFTYEPKANFNGQDHFTYTIKNEKGKSGDGMLTITVKAVNDIPQPVDDKQEISVNHVSIIDVLANDVEPDGGTLQISEVGTPDSGTVIIQNNQLVYTPATNHSGVVSFKYTVADGEGETADAWVYLTITDVNNGIILQPDTITVAEDTATTVAVSQLLANDTGDGLTVMALGEAQNGTVVLAGENFTYTPNTDFSGTDIFIYTARSSNGNTASSTVTVTVTDQSDPPTISFIADQMTTAGTTTDPISFTVQDLDTPVEELTVTATVSDVRPSTLIDPSNITITGTTENRAIRIRPTGTIIGRATITVTVSDGTSTSSEAFLLNVTDVSAGAPRIASNFAEYVIEQNTVLELDFTLADDDTWPRLLTCTATSSNQTVVPNANIVFGGNDSGQRNVVITPAGDQLGTTNITINVSDGTNNDSATFPVEVVTTGEGDTDAGAPRISNIPDQRTTQNTSIRVDFTLADNDTYPRLLTVTATSSNQTLVPDANLVPGGERGQRNLTITPTGGQVGTTTITISVSDGRNVTERSFQLEVAASALFSGDNYVSVPSGVVSLSSSRASLLAETKAVFAEDDVYTTIEDTPLTITADQGVLINATKAASTYFSVTSTAVQTSRYGGEVQLAADGGFNYIPPANFTGEDNFQYTFSPAGDTDTSYLGKVFVTVTAVNDKPLTEDDLYSVSMGEELVVTADQGVLANDRDVEGMPLQVTTVINSNMNNSNLRLNQNGSFSYTPSNESSGKEIVTYRVSDGSLSATAALTIHVEGNQAPVVLQDEYSISGRMTLKPDGNNGLLANDSDPEGEPLTMAETGVFDSLFGGEVNIDPNGGFTYSPPPNFDGFDSFIYTATDGTNSVKGVTIMRVSP